MTTTLSHSPTKARRTSAGEARRRRARAGDRRTRVRDQPPLGSYTDRHGHAREVICRPGAAGSVLVLDRDRVTLGDRRLVAHLGADEPAENAAIVCSEYLRAMSADGCRCRALTAEDARTVPFAEEPGALVGDGRAQSDLQPIDRLGRRYALELVTGGMAIPALRWCRRSGQLPGRLEQVSLREAIASIESYEPLRGLTIRALSLHAASTVLSTTVLRAELARVQESPIVLNRRLREMVLERVARDQLSMSEIAIRCGRVKRDRKGNESGETSWLARRIGLLAEGGQSTPTPWIHSDVLALIARSGLGVSPREVEL
jgi:hypothetical protein